MFNKTVYVSGDAITITDIGYRDSDHPDVGLSLVCITANINAVEVMTKGVRGSGFSLMDLWSLITVPMVMTSLGVALLSKFV